MILLGLSISCSSKPRWGRRISVHDLRVEDAVVMQLSEADGTVVLASEIDSPIETGAITNVATRSSTIDFHSQPDRILIVVNSYLDDSLDEAAGRAFAPKALTRPAPVVRFGARYRFLQRFGIHVAEHQNFARTRIACDARDQAVGVEFRRKGETFFDQLDRCAGGERRRQDISGFRRRRGRSF